MALQIRLNELGSVIVVRFVNAPPHSFTVVDEDNFHAEPAWSDGDIAVLSALEIVRYHVHFVKNCCSFRWADHFSPC